MSKASLNCVRIYLNKTKAKDKCNTWPWEPEWTKSKSNLRSWPGQASLGLEWGNNYNQLIKTEHMKAAAIQEERALESGRQGGKNKRNPGRQSGACQGRTIIKTFQRKLVKPGVWTQQTEGRWLSVFSGVFVAALVKKHRVWRKPCPVLEDQSVSIMADKRCLDGEVAGGYILICRR